MRTIQLRHRIAGADFEHIGPSLLPLFQALDPDLSESDVQLVFPFDRERASQGRAPNRPDRTEGVGYSVSVMDDDHGQTELDYAFWFTRGDSYVWARERGIHRLSWVAKVTAHGSDEAMGLVAARARS